MENKQLTNQKEFVIVKYFGIISEKTGKNEEKIELTVNDISNFLKKIFLQYNLEKFSVNISLNHEIINLNQPYNIKNGDEIAILPPFAGG
ncbi:MAG: MoaD/ThiS family protein [Flavobacteriaceae bacterium]|jgi:MoaD family protein|nr:MAG: MoaD/ThiS family protein [Flavobacteriaceae bacterium TMED220]|tara:strand:- start:1745 stop:2014 length:270 start_codon:yes stop_codon:yes gene_type:complete